MVRIKGYKEIFRMKVFSRVLLPALLGAFSGLAGATANSFPAVQDALAQGELGLYGPGSFRLADGNCPDCPGPKQGLWYFRGDTIAVPTDAVASFSAKQRLQDDIRHWNGATQGQGDASRPALVWIGSPQSVHGQLTADGTALQAGDGQSLAFSVIPKLDSNLSYYNQDSVKFFASRPLKARGRISEQGFVARSLWPADFAIQSGTQPVQALSNGEKIADLVRAGQGGAAAPSLQTRTLWSRDGKPLELAGKAVMAFVLNGAQGDDDEAHGGHFAVATGRFGAQGEWDNWLVNNFYGLDSVSEKGIIASVLPMDAYQGDLNSGQSWYRPSYLLVAVFRDGRVPALYQQGISRAFNHFYRHDFRYNHATANCAGINMETLRSLGWNIPEQGPGSRLKALVALPYMALKDASLDSGRKAYDYLMAEKTNLYPFVAFEAAGMDLLQRASGAAPATTAYEKQLHEDLEGLLFVRIPQFPSSRAFGQAPVASLDEYMERAPADRADWKIIPVPPRPFPAELKDPEAPPEEALPSTYALFGYGGFVSMLGLGGWRMRRRKGLQAISEVSK